MPSSVERSPSSIQQAENFQQILCALARYKAIAAKILPQSSTTSLPNESEIPSVLDKCIQEDGTNHLAQYQNKCLSIQKKLVERSIQHLQSIQRLRDEYKPGEAYLNWWSKKCECIDELRQFDITNTETDNVAALIRLVKTYESIILDAEERELVALAKEHSIELYANNLSVLIEITQEAGLSDAYQKGQLDYIKRIQANPPTDPKNVLAVSQNIDFLCWQTQKILLTRWTDLFGWDTKLPRLLESVAQHDIIPLNEFLTLTRKYTREDIADMKELQFDCIRRLKPLDKSFADLRKMHKFATEHDVNTTAFNGFFQRVMANKVTIDEDVSRITLHTPVKTLKRLINNISQIEAKIQPIKEELIHQSIESWHLASLKHTPIQQSLTTLKELIPLKTAATLDAAFTEAKEHAKKSKLYQVAKTIFPNTTRQLDDALSSTSLNKTQLIQTLDQYFHIMVISGYTQHNIENYPAINAIINQDRTLYKDIDSKALESLYMEYMAFSKKYSQPHRAPHLFSSFLDSARKKKSKTKERSSPTKHEPITASTLHEQTQDIVKQSSQLQSDIDSYQLLIDKKLLLPIIKQHVLDELSDTAENQRHHLLNVMERCERTNSAIRQEDLDTADKHLQYAKKHLYFAKTHWQEKIERINAVLTLTLSETKAIFDELAQTVEQYLEQTSHFDSPAERDILKSLLKRKSIIDLTKRDILRLELKLTSTASADNCRLLMDLTNIITKSIHQISRINKKEGSERYIPFNRDKHLATLSALREQAFNEDWPKLKEKADEVSKRLVLFKQYYYSHLTAAGKALLIEKTKCLSKLMEKEQIRSQLSTGLNRSLSVFKISYETQVNLIEQADSTIDKLLSLCHEPYQRELTSHKAYLQTLPPITAPYFDNKGEETKQLLCQSGLMLRSLTDLNFNPNAIYDFMDLKKKVNAQCQLVDMFKEKHAALQTAPVETLNNPLYLLHLIHRVIPELSSKIREMLAYLPTETSRESDPGFQGIRQLHYQLCHAEKYFLNGDITPQKFNQIVAKTLHDTILDERIQVSLSNYQNGKIIQWFRTNAICRAIIKFFTFMKKEPLVAGASQLEHDIYEVGIKCQKALAANTPAGTSSAQENQPCLARHAPFFRTGSRKTIVSSDTQTLPAQVLSSAITVN